MGGPTDAGEKAGAMRIPLLSREEMDDEQRGVHDSVVSGRRGQIVGPLLAALHVPKLAPLWSRFGEYLRYETSLPMRTSELAIIAIARRWSSSVEWWVHSRLAREAGIGDAVIEAISRLEPPVFTGPADRDVYEYTRILQETGQISDDLHTRIADRWGVQGVVELTALIGYYTLVAMTLNAHRIPVPGGAGLVPPLTPVDGLAILPAAAPLEGAAA